jgi:hypothetical protein
MADSEELWIPLVDEPIGSVVDQILREDESLAAQVSSPRRILAFKTFAYIRVGMILGELLMEHDIPPYDGSETWIDRLLREPAHRAAVLREIRAVAADIANDPRYAGDEPLGPDAAARERFRDFARQQLGG